MSSSSIRTKLILVDGLSGSGKSTQAQWLEVEFHKLDLPVRWFWEGEIGHPLHWFSEWWQPDFDFAVYLTDVATSMERSLRHWDEFVQQAIRKDTITIFDGFPLLLTVGLFASGDSADDRLLWYAQQLQRLIEPLSPVLIYLHQPNIRRALSRILDIRGASFERELFYNLGRFPFCAARGLNGFECVAQTWERTQSIVQRVLPDYTADQLVIDITRQSWTACQRQICAFVGLEPCLGSLGHIEQFVGVYGGGRNMNIRLENDKLVADENGLSTPLLHIYGQTFYLQALPVTITFYESNGAISGLMVDASRMSGKIQTLVRTTGKMVG